MSFCLWGASVGAGTTLAAAISMAFGVQFWNLGRIVAPGLGLIFTGIAAHLRRRPGATPGARLDPRPWGGLSVVVTGAYSVLAAVWLALGLANYFGALRADPALSVLRWPAVPISALAAGHTAFLARAGVWGVWQSCLLFWHPLARSVMAGGGLLIVAAPFELVGAEVRNFLVPSFIVATALWLLFATGRFLLRRAHVDEPNGPAFGVLAGLGLLAVALAAVPSGWAGPIAGALLAQLVLLGHESPLARTARVQLMPLWRVTSTSPRPAPRRSRGGSGRGRRRAAALPGRRRRVPGR
ncbi:MAG: hypothetical protein ACRDMV_01610 [Streptosporangiales bacterium]